jgi:2-polyprenyl-3-methyl-5-hydroxy-6-metoxy-1,4-benzoquinol methylase
MTKKLYSDNEIKDKFSKRYILYNFYKNKNKNNIYIYIISYIVYNFKIVQDLISKIVFNNVFSDAEFYLEIRKYYNKNEKQIIKHHTNLYKNEILLGKINSIKKILSRQTITVKNVLDIGTEDTHFLDLISKELNCNAVGINIDTGYEHYFENSYKNNKIILYNGIDFPFNENQFDLVTIMAVIHHIKNLKLFIKNLCKITKLIYIKDQNHHNKDIFNTVKIQHELWEGILYPNVDSPLYKVTKKYVIKLLKENNFTIIYDRSSELIGNPYIILASKNKK